jgi:hypothetical protein
LAQFALLKLYEWLNLVLHIINPFRRIWDNHGNNCANSLLTKLIIVFCLVYNWRFWLLARLLRSVLSSQIFFQVMLKFFLLIFFLNFHDGFSQNFDVSLKSW